LPTTRKLDNWIDSWMQYTAHVISPTLYHKWVAVSVLAAALERKIFLKWKWPGSIFCNFYIVLVGPPGRCKKGVALSSASSILRDLGVHLSANATSEPALIADMMEATQTYTESGGKIYSYSAITVLLSELTSFFRQGNPDIITYMCDWYDCLDDWTYDTKGRGKERIDNLWVNLLGATTPDNLIATKGQEVISQGLASRTIFVYEERSRSVTETLQYNPKTQLFETREKDQLYELLLHDLANISLLKGQFRFEKAFLRAYDQVYPSNYEDLFSHEDKRMVTYRSRRAAHHLKLSMIMNAAKSDSMLLTVQDFKDALALLEATEPKMHLTFSGLGRSDLATLMQDMMTFIALQGETTMKDILIKHHWDGTEKEITDVVAVLVVEGYCDIYVGESRIDLEKEKVNLRNTAYKIVYRKEKL